MFVFKLIKLVFLSPIIFQHGYIESPWRVANDYLVRALTHTYSKLYNIEEWFKILEQDILRVSSLILVYRNNLYFPDYGVQGYITPDGDIIEAKDLMTMVSRIRMSRIEGIDSTPFEDYQLLTSKYEWCIVLAIRDDYKKIFHKIIASLRFLGDIGLGARKSRGGGRFKVIQIQDPEHYGVKIKTSGKGKLISRYISSERKLNVKAVRRVYIEKLKIYYGNKKFREFPVIAEGSEIEINDSGLLEYFENDLLHRVPLYYRPLIVSI